MYKSDEMSVIGLKFLAEITLISMFDTVMGHRDLDFPVQVVASRQSASGFRHEAARGMRYYAITWVFKHTKLCQGTT